MPVHRAGTGACSAPSYPGRHFPDHSFFRFLLHFSALHAILFKRNFHGVLAQLVGRSPPTYAPNFSRRLPSLSFGQPLDLNSSLPVPELVTSNIWGISAVGSARHSHCRGQGFDSPMLHHVTTQYLIQSAWFFFLSKQARKS